MYRRMVHYTARVAINICSKKTFCVVFIIYIKMSIHESNFNLSLFKFTSS